jgi:SAM-dependent methyltransferase
VATFHENNRSVFSRPDVVSIYESSAKLELAEATFFDRYVHKGAAVLDLGVGAGRTTGPLTSRARHYVALDYSPVMVDAARARHPHVDIRVGDAVDLSAFDDASFDAIVFSFNGFDYLHPVESRHRCLVECHRVLRPAGVLLFSSHHARFVAARHRGSRDSMGVRRRWYTAHRAGGRTIRRTIRRMASRSFWTGHGYRLDPVHGGLVTYEATPARVTRDLQRFGFRVVDVLPSTYPRRSSIPFGVPWYHYAAIAPDIPT